MIGHVNGLGLTYGTATDGCLSDRDCCIDGKFFYNGAEEYTRGNWMSAVSTCGRAHGAAHDLAKMQLVMKAKAYYERDPSSISNRIYQGVIDCANRARCPGPSQLNIAQQATQDALAHRDVVDQAITENRSLTPEELGINPPPPVPVGTNGGPVYVSDGPEYYIEDPEPVSVASEVDPATGQRYCPALYPHGRIDALDQLICWSTDPDAWRRNTTPGSGQVVAVSSPGSSVGSEPGNGGQFFFGDPAGGNGNVFESLPGQVYDVATDEWIDGLPNWATVLLGGSAAYLMFKGKR